MYVTRKELIESRAKLLKEMNDYIFKMGNVDIWFIWAIVGIPESATEEDYKILVSNDAEWVDICDLFGRLDGINNRKEEDKDNKARQRKLR